jgi:hypothetical protein
MSVWAVGQFEIWLGLVRRRDRGILQAMIVARFSVALTLLVATGCGSHHPSAVERADLRHWLAVDRNVKSVSCDQRGDEAKVAGRTYTAYSCTVHGGGRLVDGTDAAVYWDQHRLLTCPQLPRAAQNKLCFD